MSDCANPPALPRMGREDPAANRDYQLAFKTLIAKLSTDFIRFSSEEIDQGIRQALRAIAEFAHIDRAVILSFDRDGSHWQVSHEWHPPELAPLAEQVGEITHERFPWGLGLLEAGRKVVLPSRRTLSGQALAEARLFEKSGFDSILILPLHRSDKTLAGAIGFGWVEGSHCRSQGRSRSKDLITLLLTVGEMFVNALERKRTEEALRNAESRFSSLLRSDIVGIWVGDLDGAIIEANDVVLDKLSASRADLAQGRLRWNMFSPPERHFLSDRMLERLAEVGYAGPWETEVVDVKGKRFPILAGVARLAGDPKRFVAVSQDLSALKRAQHEIEERNDANRLVADLSTRFIDLAPQDVDDAINHALGEICRFTQIERCAVFRFSPDRATAFRTHGWISERAKAEVESVPSIPLQDFPWFNERLRRGEVVHVPEVAKLPEQAQHEKRLFSERNVRTVVAVPMLLEGELLGCMLFYAIGRSKQWSDENVRMLRMLAEILVNALERKRVNEELNRLNKDLEQRVSERTRRLAASNKELEAFSYSVSHDLRTPLRGIDGFSAMLLEDYGSRLDDNARSLLMRTRQASQRLGQLIDSLLKLSRISRTEMRCIVVDLGQLTAEAITALRSSDPARRVSVEIDGDLQVWGEPRLLQVLMENLIGNAWKFTGKREQGAIKVGVEDINGERVFFVRDNGAGFDPAYSDKLFGAFERLHSTDEFPGHGIGLATSQRIVDRHGGRIWADSIPEEGATIRFTLEAKP